MTATQSQIRDALVYFQGQQIAWKTDKRAPLYDTAVEVLQSALDTQKQEGDALALQDFDYIVKGWLAPDVGKHIDGEIARVRAALAGKPKDGGGVVPGVMHCAKCKFQLIRTNLYMGNGTTGPGDNKTEPCPNGCGPLWPVSWKQQAMELGERLEEVWKENEVLKALTADNAKRGE